METPSNRLTQEFYQKSHTGIYTALKQMRRKIMSVAKSSFYEFEIDPRIWYSFTSRYLKKMIYEKR